MTEAERRTAFARAFIEQARSDWGVYRLLARHADVARCHAVVFGSMPSSSLTSPLAQRVAPDAKSVLAPRHSGDTHGTMLGARFTPGALIGVLLPTGACGTVDDGSFVQSQPLQEGVDFQEFVPTVPELIETGGDTPEVGDESSLECSSSPQELLRPDCPQQVPSLGACENEGLECLYDIGAGCVDRYDCALGFWTPLGEQCPWEDDLHVGFSSASCNTTVPISGSPCESPTLQCGYGQCLIPGEPERAHRCQCGRWVSSAEECSTIR